MSNKKEDLRKVEYWNNGIVEFTGYLHKFVGGYMSANEAIIEKDNGWLVQVPVGSIKFVGDGE